jgi:hypothetical protein
MAYFSDALSVSEFSYVTSAGIITGFGCAIGEARSYDAWR